MTTCTPRPPVVILYNVDPAWSTSDQDEINQLNHNLLAGLMEQGHTAKLVSLDSGDLQSVLSGVDPNQLVIFNWCEEIPGIPRSAALVARGLEQMGFTFTGADSNSLQFSHNKPAVKKRLNQLKIPTPAWRLYESAATRNWDLFPAIVKPAYEHCSIGITHEAVVHSHRELEQQVVRVIQQYQEPVLVEDFIDGREFHVTVVGNGKLEVFPIAEMDFSAINEDRRRLCTYASKFEPSSKDYQTIQLHLPAELTEKEHRDLEQVAIAAYRAGGCRDYARMDIRQRGDTFYVLDINPNADISPDASTALSAEKAGYSYGQLASYLVHLAAHRHPSLVFSSKDQALPIPTLVPINQE